MVAIGSAIRKFRDDREITQRELARRLGVTGPYLSAVERGHRQPSIKLLRQICEELGVPQEVLFWQAIDTPLDMPPQDRKIVMLAKRILRQYLDAKQEERCE